MEAKELFEELGYRCKKNEEQIVYGKYETSEIILFDLKTKEYMYFIAAWCDFEEADYCSIKLHKAIHQQLKELGWLDE